jgi:pyruvate/2-oxoacid:ferredoxin oxidoreductase beta subunit
MNAIEPAACFAATDYKSEVKPIWCPGCGDYTVLGSITKALALLQLPPHEVAVVSGIGCSVTHTRVHASATASTVCTGARWPRPPG